MFVAVVSILTTTPSVARVGITAKRRSEIRQSAVVPDAVAAWTMDAPHIERPSVVNKTRRVPISKFYRAPQIGDWGDRVVPQTTHSETVQQR